MLIPIPKKGDILRDFIGGLGWKMFLWANKMTQEEYWERVYEEEKYLNDF